MSSKYHDEFSGFNIDRALIDANGKIETVASNAANEGEKEAFLKSYREKVKQWMKDNHKNMKWLASQIGMSEGSTKNLLYTNLNITSEKLVAIQEAMDNGLDKTDSADLSWLILRHYEDISIHANFTAWSIAAELPLSCFRVCGPEYNEPGRGGAASAENVGKLAAWATPLLMKEAASELRPIYKKNPHALFLLRKKEPAHVRETPYGIFGGEYGYDIVVRRYENLGTSDVYTEIQLPVVASECQVQYIELAASIKEMSIVEWVVSTLNKESRRQGLINLDGFIRQYS